MFNDKKILITGGSGSLGKELVEYLLANYKPKAIRIYSRGELKQYLMAEEYPDDGKSPMRYFIGDVRDKDRLRRALKDVDYVIHAAAMKQVPTCEYNPFEAVLTNVIGAQNVIESSIDMGVKKVITLSSDKACNPINLYGATKLCSDKLFVAANVYSGDHKTQFSVVRYGNVMSSRGSVIPYFQELVKKGEPIPITDERMTRFWITLPDAVKFIADNFNRMSGGEIFIPKIPSMKIIDLARAIGGIEHTMVLSGIRPGEKLHEVMISTDDARKTVEGSDFYAILPDDWIKGGETYIGNLPTEVRRVSDSFEYSSGTNTRWMTIRELKSLI